MALKEILEPLAIDGAVKMIRVIREKTPASICGAQTLGATDATSADYLTVHYERDVVRVQKDVPSAVDQLVKRAILESVGTPFFAITPLTRQIRGVPDVMSRLTELLLDSGLGYLTRDDGDLDAHLERRRRLSSYEEWVFGCCTERFVRPPDTRLFSDD